MSSDSENLKIINGYGTTTLPNDPTNNTLINKNFVTTYFSNSSINMIGEISFFAGLTPPSGWKFCDGTPLSKTTFKSLFDVIGTTYGEDPYNTDNFLLPNFTSRVPICSEQSESIGIMYKSTSVFSGGNKTMDTNQIPSHSHSASHTHSFNFNSCNVGICGNCRVANGNATTKITNYEGNGVEIWQAAVASSTSSGNTGNSGSGQEFLPPFCVVNFIIYTGVFL